MWIFTNHGFYSIVKDKSSETNLLVRARKREHLEVLFDRSRITYSPKRDYQYRVNAHRDEVSDLLYYSTNDITYTNFKNSITDSTLNRMANILWSNWPSASSFVIDSQNLLAKLAEKYWPMLCLILPMVDVVSSLRSSCCNMLSKMETPI